MSRLYKVLTTNDLGEQRSNQDHFARDILQGLSASPKHISSKYFYDDRGSELFAAITDLEEYYPTRHEHQILEHRKSEIAEIIGDQPFNLMELGAGDGRKTILLLEEFLKRDMDFQYIPLDISEAAVDDLTTKLSSKLPSLKQNGLVSEYFDGISWFKEHSRQRNVVLFLGSNVGNFNRETLRNFMSNLWHGLNNDDIVLIGFDMRKDIDTMRQAYADSEGVTAEFNLNLLRRMNRELGADFDVDSFQHVANYNFDRGAMESFLVSKRNQTVTIPAVGRRFDFEAWEGIHLEYSYKFSESQIDHLAQRHSFELVTNLYSENRWFCDSIWRVKKDHLEV